MTDPFDVFGGADEAVVPRPAFAEDLRRRGVNVTVRDTRGSDIDAACGQLRAGHEATAVAPPARRR